MKLPSSSPSVNFNTIPVFEVRNANGDSMQIFTNGTIAGFPEGYTLVINRIPMFMVQSESTKK